MQSELDSGPTGQDEPEASPYRQAALGYALLGALVLLITVASPALLAPERRADLAHLLVGLPFFLLFALAIAFLDRPVAALSRALGAHPERSRRIGRWSRQGLVMLLTLSAFVRTLVFVGNGLGWRLRLGTEGATLQRADAEPRMLLSALLMGAVCALLFRASWLPIVRRAFRR